MCMHIDIYADTYKHILIRVITGFMLPMALQ